MREGHTGKRRFCKRSGTETNLGLQAALCAARVPVRAPGADPVCNQGMYTCQQRYPVCGQGALPTFWLRFRCISQKAEPPMCLTSNAVPKDRNSHAKVVGSSRW